MQIGYFYFMKREPDRVRATAPEHSRYWQELTPRGYRGGPFADRSGGLIVFESDSLAEAASWVDADPFQRDGLLESRWLKEWVA